MKAVPRSNGSHGRVVLLAPPHTAVPGQFKNVNCDPELHEELLAATQRLRARLYLEEGAIERSQISVDGRHQVPVDGGAWQLVAINTDGEVYGCARYMSHPNTASFSQLEVRKAALANSGEWGSKLHAAVESEIELARSLGVAFVEVGGWALAPEFRFTMEALRIALSTYSLARALGGCIGVGMVTRRHCSASILRRIGGRPLTTNQIELPDYFDPHYQCQMEMLRFDSRDPNPRFEPWINELVGYLLTMPVIRAENPILRLHDAVAGQSCGVATPSSMPSQEVLLASKEDFLTSASGRA